MNKTKNDIGPHLESRLICRKKFSGGDEVSLVHKVHLQDISDDTIQHNL